MRRNCFGCGLSAALFSLLASVAVAQSGKPLPISQLAVEAPSVVQRSIRVRHTNPNQILHLAIGIAPADSAGLESFVDSVSDPANPNYHNFLTPEEVGQRFGVPAGEMQGIASYLAGKGFKINLVAKNRLSILADGTVTQAEAAFHTTINDYHALSPTEAGHSDYFSFTGKLQLPAAIGHNVIEVSGLESFTRPQPRSTLTPTQTRVLYSLAPMYNGGKHGEGRNVAISNFDGYRLTNVPLYYSQYGLPAPSGGVGSNIHVVAISGGAGGGSPQGEGDLDIQMALGMAPLCNFTIYDGGGSNLLGVLTQEANDNLADVISESYGWSLSASTATACHNEHLSMSAEGITYMAASGDSGTTLEPYSYPDYDPEVLMVGGSSATVDSSGNRTAEVGWNSGGGGWSTNTATFNVLPAWQHGTGVPTSVPHRLVPDVALHASGTQTSTAGAYFFYYNGALTSGYIGTSFASPVFAGSLAVTEQNIIAQGGLPANGAGKQRFGRIQDVLYSQNMRSDVWLDLTSGSNGNLPNGTASHAGAGWDYVTGLGVINFNAFAGTQVATNPDFGISAGPASQTVVQGSGTSYTVNTSVINGFSGSVSLSVSGLPSGAGGVFTPASVTAGSGSSLSVTTAATTPTGTYTLTITGTSGTLVHSTTVTLIVNSSNPANFTISASPSTRTVTRGSSASYTITITPQNGFAGTVSFSTSGAPSTVTFSPTTVTGSGSTTMTLRTTRSTTRKTYNVTVTGTSGSLSHSTTVSLVVH